jgi:hypothetical protein
LKNKLERSINGILKWKYLLENYLKRKLLETFF